MSDETDGGIRLPNEGAGDTKLEEVVRKFREDKAREVFERVCRLERDNAILKAEAGRPTKGETFLVKDDSRGTSMLATFMGEVDGCWVVKLAASSRVVNASEVDEWKGWKARAERAEAEVEQLRSEVLSRPGHGDAVVMVTTTELLRLNKLEGVVKRVLARKADDVCWRDVYTEMAGLVGVELEPELLERSSFLRNCSHFYDCLAKGEQYHAPPTDDLLRRAAASLCEVIREDGGSLLRGDMARAWLNMEMVLRTGKEL